MFNAKRTAASAEMHARDRLIVALDVAGASEARRLVDQLEEYAGAFKVGLQLFAAAGPEFVRELVKAGRRVFLDLKFHDIPNTVGKAGVEAVRLGVWMFNVHAAGGNEMMRQVVSEVDEACDRERLGRPKIIAVTVLTSSTDTALREIGIERTAAEQVANLARLAKSAGMDGVVASPVEIDEVRRSAGTEFLIVTPGVRPMSAAKDDQKRVMTPGDALRAGADHIVVGRPITSASDPRAAARAMIEEMTEALK